MVQQHHILNLSKESAKCMLDHKKSISALQHHTSEIYERLNTTWKINLNGLKVSPSWTNLKAAEIKKLDS